MTRLTKSSAVPGLLVFLGGCSYGLLASLVKLGYQRGLAIERLTLGQYLVGVCLLWISWGWLSLYGQAKSGPISPKEWIQTFVIGSTVGLTGIFYNEGLRTLPASLSVVLLFQFTWIGVLVESIASRRRPSSIHLVSIFMLLIGTLLASGLLSQAGHFASNVKGVVFGLLSALTYSLFIFSSGRIGLSFHPICKSALTLTSTSLLLMLLLPSAWVFRADVSGEFLIFTGALGFLGAFVPGVFFATAMPKVGVGLGSILSASELPVGLLMAYLVLGEDVQLLQWIGVVAILVGIALPQMRVRLFAPAVNVSK